MTAERQPEEGETGTEGDRSTASNDDITQAVALLANKYASEPDATALPAEPSDTEGCSTVNQETSGEDDVSHKDELQTAIALSLLEAANHQPEERDFSRSREQQATESKCRTKRKRCEVWGDHPNPNDLRRDGDWPVGLKNIGNTCWFSAVIQSLFHLPEFRRLVQSYSLPQSIFETCQNRNEKRNISFMHELQYLFALMTGSKRKFVDPSAALELLNDAFLSAEAQQQDVSEFTHKLLDWLEDAFQLAVNAESSSDKLENPMVQLFYGTFLTEGFREDKTFSNVETFGQYPLQVNGFYNLSECIEGAMVEGEIENLQTGSSVKYRQERWFTKLPPVLTFELSRFEFNQSLGQPEKIHNKLEFQEIIYMDRYLYKNKALIRKKREQIQKLQGCMNQLQQRLERYMKYGSGPHRCPLPEMLQYVLEFASRRSAAVGHENSLLHTEDSDSPDTQPLENGLPGEEDIAPSKDTCCPAASLVSDGASVQSMRKETAPGCLVSEYPAPRTASEDELHAVETCLQRWRTEVDQDIQELKNCISNIRKSIENIYVDPELSEVPYRLHAVLVHEGQAEAGHYWAYIYSHSRNSWLKYNDISVTEASWEEVQRDSYGGMRNASAYCLMYINRKLPYLIADADAETGQLLDKIDALPPTLRRYVRAENRRFEHEAEEWEGAHSCKMSQMEPATTFSSDECAAYSDASPQKCGDCSRSLSSEHAMMTKEQTALAINKTAVSYEQNGVEAALKEPTKPEPEEKGQPAPNLPAQAGEDQTDTQLSEVDIPSVGKILVRSDADGYNEEAFREEYSRLYKLAHEDSTPSSDPRLQHVLVYFFQNQAPERVVERTLLEQFADKNLSYDERSISIMKVAQAKLKEIGPDDMDMKEYKKWHEDYSLFRKVSIYLLTGLELYQHGKYQEALTYLVYAYQSNSELLSVGANRGVEESIIKLYRRKCLKDLNDTAAILFESGQEEHVTEGVGIMNDLIIPCMQLIFNNSTSQEDLAAIEEMRSRWCSYLGQDLDDNLQLKLGEFLPRLLDCSNDIIVLKEPPKIRPHSPYDLCNRFTAVMESIQGASAVTVT
ncbi:ubiquitin carboxyl-terminal hydrolase 28 isoform X2 [Bombina bombina]|uniref:ubiquitin carboxyl-terminal hydrolase 28 isoform X2 n=1 Tax=Bombina bombina TaxID=8345 RepID=UPI00235B302E|nr:ubiquitin carboxyl-terminal hydrolase 28 isoform X2 [Bombina bombina]